MTLVSQAEYARRKAVSRAAVTQWKDDGRLVMIGKMIDLESTEALLQRTSSSRSKRIMPAGVAAVKCDGDGVKPRASLNTPEATALGGPAVYLNGADYGEPANLPRVVVEASVTIEVGAIDMAELALRHLPVETVRPLVEDWVRRQKAHTFGGPGLPDTEADLEWPAPPLGYQRWSDHPLFTDPAPSESEWKELAAEAEAGVAA